MRGWKSLCGAIRSRIRFELLGFVYRPARCVAATNSICSTFQVPELLGTTENELGLRKWLEDQGHTLVTTSDKEGENSKFDQELVDADVIITTP
jgi:hypothetical protein